MESIFELNKYLISQKMLSMRGKYHIFNENGENILYVEQVALLQIKPSFTIYRDKNKQQKLLSIKKDRFLQLVPTYTISDEMGNPIGHIRKKLFALFKSTWNLFDAQGKRLCTIQQDTSSVVLGMMTRSGTELSNFNFLTEKGKQLGSLKRKGTIADRYLLDLSADINRQFDRRLAICTSIILDIGERR